MKYFLIFLFVLSGLIGYASNGDSFDNAIAINALDTVTFPEEKTKLYYSFTVTQPLVIDIPLSDDHYMELFRDDLDQLDYSFDNHIKDYLEPGTYYLSLENKKDSAFTWVLNLRDAIPGEYCPTPYKLDKTEKITYKSNVSDEMYFKYTAENDGKICFNNLPFVKLEIFDECGGNSLYKKNDIDNISFEVTTGNTYIIEMYHASLFEFIFDFTIADGLGESCEKAIEILNYGTVSSIVGSGAQYFKFIAPETGVFEIKSDSTGYSNDSLVYLSQIKLFGNCNTASYNDFLIASSYHSLSWNAQKDDELIIKCEFNNAGFTNKTFSYTILKANEVGNSCENAKIISAAGDVVFPADKEFYYYQYTPTRDCRIEISNGDDLGGDIVLYRNCNEEEFQAIGYYGEKSIHVEKGETFEFKYQSVNNYGAAFTFTLTENDFSVGEVCYNPELILSAGDIEASKFFKNHWYYSYTATMNGVLKVSDGTYNDNPVNVYIDCNESSMVAMGSAGECTLSAVAGTTYIFDWYSGYEETFTWTLEERTSEVGEVAENPIIISAMGTEASPAEFELTRKNGFTYYSFTPSSDQMMVITNNNKYQNVSVWIASNTLNSTYGNNGELEMMVKSGETYIIKWDNENYSTTFNWYGYTRDLLAGETEFNPIVIANLGDVNYPDGRKEVHYSYTPTSDGIASVSDNDNTAWASPSSSEVAAGNAWKFTYYNSNETSFTFTLAQRDKLSGEFCANAIAFANDGTASTSTELSTTYFSYTTPSDGIYSITNGTNTSGIYVNSDCSFYTDNYFSHYGNGGEVAIELKANQTLIVSCYNDKEAVDLKISSATPEVGESKSNPFIIAQAGTVNFIGTQKNLVDNYYTYTPTKNETITLSEDGAFNIYTLQTGDTIVETWYEETDFNATKNTTYIIHSQRLNNTNETWNLSSVENLVATQGIAFSVMNNNEAITNASVTIGSKNLTTDANGKVFIELANGKYTYTITASNYESISGEINLVGYTQGVTAVLLPKITETYKVNFSVSNNSEAIEGATIAINDSTIYTDASGNASISLPNGQYSYSVSASGCQNYEQQVTVSDKDETINIALIAEGETVYALKFEVNSGSDMIAGAVITINNTQIETNSNGEAVIKLPNGTYPYTITSDIFDVYSGEITVSGEDITKQIPLTKTVGVNKNKSSVTLYPNPAKSFIQINSNTTIVKIEIYALNGMLVKQQNANTNFLQIDDLNNGLYLLNIQYNTGSEIMHFIKE